MGPEPAQGVAGIQLRVSGALQVCLTHRPGVIRLNRLPRNAGVIAGAPREILSFDTEVYRPAFTRYTRLFNPHPELPLDAFRPTTNTRHVRRSGLSLQEVLSGVRHRQRRS